MEQRNEGIPAGSGARTSSGSGAPRVQERSQGVLLARCEKLSLPCVRCEGGVLEVLGAGIGEEARAFLSCPVLTELMKGAAERWGFGECEEAVSLFEGCWLLPVWSGEGSRAGAVLLTEEALRSGPFGVVCAATGIEPDRMRDALDRWVQRGMRGPDRLAAVLRWTREDLESADKQDSLLRDFSDKLIQSYEETHVLFRIMRFMASSGSPRQQVQLVCNQILQILPFRWVGVVFRDHERVEASLRGQVVLAGGLPCAEQELRSETALLLASQQGDNWTQVLYPGDSVLAGRVGAEIACDTITYNGSVVGALLAGNKIGPDEAIASPEIQFIDAVADFLGTFHENAVRFAEQQALFIGSLKALTAAIDAKDPYTRGHSERVAYLSGALAAALGHGEEAAERARVAGLVHDIGKIGVPEAILCKAGRLTDEEFEAIKRHPEVGHKILTGIEALHDVLPGVLHHHERWDGRGYPHRLAGEKIPLIARIIGLADTFDAMSSTRSYRPALPREHVIREIEKGAGTQFDPRIVEAFRSVDLVGYDELLARRPVVAEPAPLGMAA